VRLDVGGSAANGVDYESISGYVNLLPGHTTSLITVTPTPDASLQGGAETVCIAIVPDPAYRLGAVSRARVVVIDQAATLAAWRARECPGATGSLEAFAAEDPDGLGVPYLLRYALGMGSGTPDYSLLPRGVVRDGCLTLDVRRNPGAEDVRYVVEVSDDLVTWHSSPARVEEISPAEHAGDPGVTSHRALPPMEEAQKLFMRLRVVYEP
jgi:hypothetical protein